MTIFDQPEHVLATATKLLEAEGMRSAAALLREAEASFEQTGFDNWNGGTNIYTLYLRVSPEIYAKVSKQRETLQKQITERLKPIIEQKSNDWFSVTIAPAIVTDPMWRNKPATVSEMARRTICDIFRVTRISWAGNLDEVEFLERIFDLQALPSNDSRFNDAARDIWQHRINNPDDWEDDWVFADRRFNLLKGPDDVFLKFLCECVHPAVRPDKAQASELVSQFNEILRHDGWRLVEEELLAGHPRYNAVPVSLSAARTVSRGKSVADALQAGWMQREIKRLESAINTDPSAAIGTAKDLVESCCKSILARDSVEVPKTADLPKLVKMVAKQLNLVPEGIPEAARGAETIRVLLSNLTQITQGLAELRGLYGSGHGRAGNYRGLEERHARLAAGAAVILIDFITETSEHRREKMKA